MDKYYGMCSMDDAICYDIKRYWTYRITTLPTHCYRRYACRSNTLGRPEFACMYSSYTSPCIIISQSEVLSKVIIEELPFHFKVGIHFRKKHKD